VHSVFGKINYGGLKHNSLYMGLVLPSDRASFNGCNLNQPIDFLLYLLPFPETSMTISFIFATFKLAGGGGQFAQWMGH
jgi:hypothetical protein